MNAATMMVTLTHMGMPKAEAKECIRMVLNNGAELTVKNCRDAWKFLYAERYGVS